MTRTNGLETHMAAVALEQLRREPVVAEYNRRPSSEKAEFMMAYAAYVMWVIMVSMSKTQETQKVDSVVTAIYEAFWRCDWYRRGVFERIWDSIQESLPTMQPGPRTGILIPLVHVIVAANRAGCHLQQTNDMVMMMDSVAVLAELAQCEDQFNATMNKPATLEEGVRAERPAKRWWQFWR